jgi:hypothetical protein
MMMTMMMWRISKMHGWNDDGDDDENDNNNVNESNVSVGLTILWLFAC